jgi:hypothetical protein
MLWVFCRIEEERDIDENAHERTKVGIEGSHRFWLVSLLTKLSHMSVRYHCIHRNSVLL